MPYNYQSLEDGQIVISDERREDLEELARWETISDEVAAAATISDDDTDTDDDLADIRIHASSVASATDVLELGPNSAVLPDTTDATFTPPAAEPKPRGRRKPADKDAPE